MREGLVQRPVLESALSTAPAVRRSSRAVSTAIGSSSASRTRRTTTTGSEGTIPSVSASSGVEGRISRASTRDVGTRPWRSISWENVMSRSARRWAGASPTKLPRPGTRTTSPSSASRCIALRAVIRLTPNSSHSSASDGSGSPGAMSWMRSRSERSMRRQCGTAVAVVTPGSPRRGRAPGHPVGGPFGPVHRRPDRPGPDPELGGDQGDRVERRRVHPQGELGPDRREQQVAAAATPPPMTTVSGESTTIMLAIPMPRYRPTRARPARARSSPALASSRPPRRSPSRTPPIAGRPRERLEAAVVAAPARRPVGVDRLVADLARGPVVPMVDAPGDGDDPAHPGPERQPDHRRRAPPRPEPQLGEPERPRVVDRNAGPRAARPPGPRRAARPTLPGR